MSCICQLFVDWLANFAFVVVNFYTANDAVDAFVIFYYCFFPFDHEHTVTHSKRHRKCNHVINFSHTFQEHTHTHTPSAKSEHLQYRIANSWSDPSNGLLSIHLQLNSLSFLQNGIFIHHSSVSCRSTSLNVWHGVSELCLLWPQSVWNSFNYFISPYLSILMNLPSPSSFASVAVLFFHPSPVLCSNYY